MTTDPTATLNTALAKAQGELTSAHKGNKNPAFGSKYADLASVLEAVRVPMSSNGIAITHLIESNTDARVVTLRTILRHSSGEVLDCGPISVVAKDGSPQAIGSALTYCRRYGVMMACGIAPDDDDGNAGSGASAPKTTAERKAEHHESWAADQGWYFAQLAKLGVAKDTADALCAAMNRPRPSLLDKNARSKFIAYLSTDAGTNAIAALNSNHNKD